MFIFHLGIHCNYEATDNIHVTFKENAMFLLDLASTTSTSGRSTTTDGNSYWKSGPWAVGEFKCLANLEASARQLQSDSDDSISVQLRDFSSGVRYRARLPWSLGNRTIAINFVSFSGVQFRPRRGGRGHVPEFPSVRVDGHREVSVESPRHDQPPETDQQHDWRGWVEIGYFRRTRPYLNFKLVLYGFFFLTRLIASFVKLKNCVYAQRSVCKFITSPVTFILQRFNRVT